MSKPKAAMSYFTYLIAKKTGRATLVVVSHFYWLSLKQSTSHHSIATCKVSTSLLFCWDIILRKSFWHYNNHKSVSQ